MLYASSLALGNKALGNVALVSGVSASTRLRTGRRNTTRRVGGVNRAVRFKYVQHLIGWPEPLIFKDANE